MPPILKVIEKHIETSLITKKITTVGVGVGGSCLLPLPNHGKKGKQKAVYCFFLGQLCWL
jgi:hypothetical protein